MHYYDIVKYLKYFAITLKPLPFKQKQFRLLIKFLKSNSIVSLNQLLLNHSRFL